MKRTALRRQSAKRATANRERAKVTAELLELHPHCQAGLEVCTGRSTEVHEPLTRARGGSIVDPANMVAICSACHRYVHSHPTEATELGLLVPSWQKPLDTL